MAQCIERRKGTAVTPYVTGVKSSYALYRGRKKRRGPAVGRFSATLPYWKAAKGRIRPIRIADDDPPGSCALPPFQCVHKASDLDDLGEAFKQRRAKVISSET